MRIRTVMLLDDILIYNLDSNALESIESSTKKNLKKYVSGDEEWLLRFLDEKRISPKKSRVLLRYVTLDTTSGIGPSTDAENAIRLHKSLKVSRSDASYGGLWTYLSHSVFLNYMSYRWSLDDLATDADKVSRISERYVLRWNPSQRELARNGLSRLWWAAQLSYDEENSDDPYELTKTLFDLQDIAEGILDRSFTSNKNITIPLLRRIKTLKEEGRPIKKENFFELMKRLNSAGGAIMMDSMDGNDLIQMFEKFTKWRP